MIMEEQDIVATIEKELFIKASPEKIFNFVVKSSNLTKLWPSLLEITNEKLLPNGGYCAEWKYKMAGTHLKGKSACTEVVPNQWFLVKIDGAVSCTMKWTLQSNDNIHTKVTVTVDYRTHFTPFRRLTENIIAKLNERESDMILDNLKEYMEMNE